jgi:hypothetical protein
MAAAAGARPSQVDYPTIEHGVEQELTDAEIADRAYSYWEARGYQGGSAEEDWLRAVQELTVDPQK